MCSDWSPKKKLFLDRVRPYSHGNKTKTDPPGLSSCSQTNGTEFNMANCGEDWTNGGDGDGGAPWRQPALLGGTAKGNPEKDQLILEQ